ncbi:MAG: hypothetical protein H0W89_05115 [Candidatus Levybacteria bacterium]|nr:hypothetical protein [Candidatus Levybacteria bacterium]
MAVELGSRTPDKAMTAIGRPGGRTLDDVPPTTTLPVVGKDIVPKNIVADLRAAYGPEASMDLFNPTDSNRKETKVTKPASRTSATRTVLVEGRGEVPTADVSTHAFMSESPGGEQQLLASATEARSVAKADPSKTLTSMRASTLARGVAAPPPKYEGCLVYTDPASGISDKEGWALVNKGYIDPTSGRIFRPSGWEWKEPQGFLYWGGKANGWF